MNKLFYGDNLEVLRGFSDACIDLIHLDSPVIIPGKNGSRVAARASHQAGSQGSLL